MISWISLGYLNSTYMEESDLNILENRALTLILKATVLRSLEKNKVDSAMKHLNEVMLMESYVDKMYIALARVELAKCYFKKGQPEITLKYFHDVLRMTSFSWDDQIKHKVRHFVSLLSNSSSAIEEVLMEEEEEENEENEEEKEEEEKQ